MSKPFKQSFGITSPSFLTLIFVLVFTFVLSGCGGGGGGGQEPVSRELMLNKINEIQATERAINSDDDVVTRHPENGRQPAPWADVDVLRAGTHSQQHVAELE